MAAVGFSRAENHGRPVGLVRGIRIVLGFQADGVALFVLHAVLSGDGTVEEVAAVYLEAGLAGVHHHRDAGLGRVQEGGQLLVVALGVQDEIVVITHGILGLVVFRVDEGSDEGGDGKVERGVLHRLDFTRGHEGGVDGGIARSVDHQHVVGDGVVCRVA